MQGGEGTGKGTLANAMAHILGPSAFATSRSNDVVGKFNAHLRHRVFLFCDEAFFAGNRHDADALKALITEPTFSTEGKGGAILSWPNYLHIMMASNANRAVNASLDSRRYFVLKVAPLTSDRGEAYFAAIRAELADGGYEATLATEDVHLPEPDEPDSGNARRYLVCRENCAGRPWFPCNSAE